MTLIIHKAITPAGPGIEQSYEEYLRGVKGVEILLRDAHGRIKGRYEEGLHDIQPESGKNLKLSLVWTCRHYGEKLMQNKLGGIVMIEPETGEVLCMVSAPTYDPSILIGRQRGKELRGFAEGPVETSVQPSAHGAISSGSTFKPTQGLIFLQEGVITPETQYTCAHGYTFRGGKPACPPGIRLL